MKGYEKLYPSQKIYGPYVRKSDDRSYYVLVDIIEGKVTRKSKKTSILKSRLMMEIHNGCRIPDGFEVDHIDGDRTNDVLENLRVIPREVHKSNDGARVKRKRTSTEEICIGCGCGFSCSAATKKVAGLLGRNPTCSRECASKMYGANQYAEFGIRR